MLSIIVLLLVLAMAWVWSTQGLFSAFVHLVLTIIAGTIAFALWEPFVYGILLNRQPEQAWGLGLLLPFGLVLLILRIVFDKMVTGNLSFHNLVDKIGGGVLGFCSGVLTMGLCVIGIQMVGMPSIFEYQGFELTSSGEVQRKQSLWIPVDTVASGFFTTLSGGSMHPILGSASLRTHYPNLAQEASFYHQSPFWTSGLESSRRAMAGKALTLAGENYLALNEAPQGLKDSLQASGQTVLIIGTQVTVQTNGDIRGAADQGGVFRVAPQQVELVADSRIEGIQKFYPVGFILNGIFVPLAATGEFAWSGSAGTVTHHWVFKVPQGTQPMFLYVKRVRLDLRDVSASTDMAKADELITGSPTVRVEDPEPTTSPAGPVDEQIAVISAALPFQVNKNRVDPIAVKMEGNAIVSGEAKIVQNQEDRFAGGDLRLASFYHVPTARIVRVNLGLRKGQSLLGQVLFAAQTVTVPVLVTESNQQIQPIGFTVHTNAQFRFKYDLSTPLRAISEIRPGDISDTEQVRLYYQVDMGQTVRDLKFGTKVLNPSPLNLRVQ